MKDYFLPIFLFSSFLSLLFVAGCNFILDGDSLYLKKILFSGQADVFSSLDHFAITDIQLDERLLKKGMLHSSIMDVSPDCAIIGSSRAMLISSIYKTAPAECKTLVNLSVSGAGVEDVLLMSYYLAQLPEKSAPKHIYIDLSHWSFRWNAEESWKILKRDYSESYNFFMRENADTGIFDLSFFTNLLSLDYLIHSFKVFAQNDCRLVFSPYKVIREPFSWEDGPVTSSILRDGSRVYSAEQRLLHKNPVITGAEEYKISTEEPDSEVVKVYSKIADHFRRRGVKVTFFAMPYHSATLKKEGPMSKVIKEAQRSLDGLNGNAGDSVLGSFFIEETSCNDNQMMDFMHPNSECVKLIMQ